jgi:nucleoside-diphosphate-sugar epimerase
MRILVAGATGALGRHLVPRLIAAGHQVIGTTRHPAKVDMIRQLGGEPAVVDGLDEDKVRQVVRSVRPAVIVHEMTDLSGAADLRHFDQVFATSNRLRTTGLDHLLAAARETAVTRIVAQSYCGWPYAREGSAVKSETDLLDPHPPREFRRSLDAIRYLEGQVTRGSDLEGVVLRYGAFYGVDTGLFDRLFVEKIAKRHTPVIGSGEGWWSFVHIEDAADATTLAVEHGRPGAIYNIVDDEAAQVRDWLPFLARLIGAKPPRYVPAWLGRIVAGQHLVAMMTEVRAGSNAKAKRELRWQPKHPSWRAGFEEVARERSLSVSTA